MLLVNDNEQEEGESNCQNKICKRLEYFEFRAQRVVSLRQFRKVLFILRKRREYKSSCR